KRIGRLKDNLAKLEKSGIHTSAVECDLLELNATKLSNYSLPARFDAVMLDAPCTNTGVIQRRIDVKWRLKPKDISQCAQLQLQLLQKAADFVKPSGRIVYSTCSIDPDENRNLVNTFLSSNAGKTFTLIDAVVSLPWKSGHDGAGAFLMKRAG
ncbi:MAG: RNA methyltransferase, partial [Opitutales bacterium]